MSSKLRERIKHFMKLHDLDVRAFGRNALRDHGSVEAILAGRNPRSDTVERLETYMDLITQNGLPEGDRTLVRRRVGKPSSKRQNILRRLKKELNKAG